MKLLQVTTHENKRIGLPAMCAVMICEISEAAREHQKAPDARTTLVVDAGTGQRGGYMLRDSFEQIVNLFPIATGGRGWIHAKDSAGMRITFPEGTIRSYEETGEDRFTVMIDIVGGPLGVQLEISYEDLERLLSAGDAGE